MYRLGKGTALSVLALATMLALAACKREPAAAPADTATAAQPAPVDEAVSDDPAELKDVIENTPSYVVGISYPPVAAKYPGLAQALHAYAEAARAELMQAVEGLGNDRPTAPYELSLSFEQRLDTPSLVAVAADGSRYTGGAHGEPLVARFVWLPQQQRMLEARELITSADGWRAVGGYAAAQLRAKVEARADSEQLSPEDRQALVSGSEKMIAEGTAADPDNFSQFEPVVDGAGRITALRFVFPPYQVGPYSDGTQWVEVPASVLLPHVAPDYAGLFAN
ncbi:DUF3298 and DUF4163 domain-containing protein [Stenotrophomonas sp. MMGLT7]|uniref:DUF3298 and DUF4163 domain-containing protein n=1 Tax=Stenotrophomonas sp. MMGLT7 TaxID=2901227 RepID=UPI001E2F06BC|nr:DUF3298 and DUF4163 domain-containing protein [Stenotrophomonas sp. MMGLT7]MCD7098747.1 DUF3298 and DUF4163 domain-containing protein [Stenotrophomonas sp. MMGLT7]